MDADYYYNKLLRIMCVNDSSMGYHYTDDFIKENQKQFELVKEKISNIIKKGHTYLLTDDYFYYITSIGGGYTYDFFLKLTNHLENLAATDQTIIVYEIQNYYCYLYEVINFEHNHNTRVDIVQLLTKEKLENVYKIIYTIDYLMESLRTRPYIGNQYLTLVKNILLTILSYSTYMKDDFTKYENYINNMINNLDSYIEKLYMNGMCLRDSEGNIKYLLIFKYIEYLFNHLNSNIKNKKNIK